MYMYVCLQIQQPLFLSDFNGTSFSRKIFKKSPDIKSRGNPSYGRRVRTDRQTWRS